jgi:hypothetical protein
VLVFAAPTSWTWTVAPTTYSPTQGPSYTTNPGYTPTPTCSCYAVGEPSVNVTVHDNSYYSSSPSCSSSSDKVCSVYNPWWNFGSAYNICYDPGHYRCTSTEYLCPKSHPYACGTICFSESYYQCQVDWYDFYNSHLVSIGTLPGK